MLTDFIEKRDDIEKCSYSSVRLLDSVLNIERFGFKRVDEDNVNKILNLFTVTGDLLMFKNSKDLYKKYFEWYTKNVNKEEVEEVYSKLGIAFEDIIWLNQADKESSESQRKLIPNTKQ
ncbi:MAG: hypothetical protein IJK67_06115 [Bacilli bacterium]|nr:hypothetical protein [Bacilli bacterium]